MLLALGIACALVERNRSGEGQVVDAAMVDGAALLTTMFYAQVNNGTWGERGTNTIDSGAHYYDTYETSDGKYVSIGSIEPQFYAELRRLMGLDEPEWDAQHDASGWPALKEKIAARFKEKTRDEWCEILESSPDVCFAPVLSFDEAHEHPHNAARGTFTTRDGMLQPSPAPRFSRTPGEIAGPPAHPGQHTEDALVDWGFTAAEVTKLRNVGAVR
jgi:alpha-methylacyl-CoA racemase